MRKLSYLLLVVASLFLSSCVEDFGDYWMQGYVDPTFEGRWKATRSASFINGNWVDEETNIQDESYDAAVVDNHIQVSKVVTVGNDNQPMSLKIIELSGKKFFMIRDFEDKGVDLMLYETSPDGNTLKLYPLPKERLAKAVQDGNIKGRVENGMPVVARLDEALVSFIEQLPKSDESWPKFVEYVRVEPDKD